MKSIHTISHAPAHLWQNRTEQTSGERSGNIEFRARCIGYIPNLWVRGASDRV